MARRSENPEVAVLQDWRDSVDQTLIRIENKIDALDKKFAAKWVQTVVAGLIAAILLGFVAVMVNFFIPSTRHLAPSVLSPTSSSQTPSGGSGAPSVNSTVNSHSDTATPSDSQKSTSDGGVNVTLPKVIH